MSSRKLFTKMGFCIFTRIFLWVLTAISNFSPIQVYVIISAAAREYELIRGRVQVFLLTIGSSPRLATPQSASLTAPLKGASREGCRGTEGKFSPPLHYLKGATRGAAKTPHHIVKIHRNHKSRPDGIPSGRLLYWLIACNYARPEEPFPLPSADEPLWSSRSPQASWKYT